MFRSFISFRKIQLLASAITLIFFSLTPSAAKENALGQITTDFKNLKGHIVQSVENEFVIDLDRSSGVAVGDVFCVIKPGKELIHPVSGQKIGTLEEPKGFLKVTQLKKGYSFAKGIKLKSKIIPGDRIRRYENLKAIFWDYSKRSEQFGLKLGNLLPWLKWESYEKAQRSKPEKVKAPETIQHALYFILIAERLEVRGPDFSLIHQYNFSGLTSEKAKVTGYSVIYNKLDTLGAFPTLTVMADFIRIDNQRILATTDGKKIYIFRVVDKLIPLTFTGTPYPGQILSIKWWRPNENQSTYLSVSFWAENKISSLIYVLEANQLKLVKDRIPRVLGAFDIDGDNKPETLLGQSIDRESFYGRDIKEIKLTDGKIKLVRAPIFTPTQFTVIGSQIGDITGDGTPETIFTKNGFLHIFQGEKHLYTSPKGMGGSISILTYDIDADVQDVMTSSVSFEVSPVIIDIDKNGTTEVISISSDRPSAGVPGISSGIKVSQINVLRYYKGRFELGKINNQIDGAVQGLSASDGLILFVTSESDSFLGNKGSSHLFAMPLIPR